MDKIKLTEAAKPKVTKTRSINSGLAPYTTALTRKDVTHLLKRTMFGAKPAHVNYFLTKPLATIVAELLNPSASLPAAPIKEYATTTTPGTTPDTTVAVGTTWINDINNDGTVQSQRRSSYKKWYTGVLLNQDRSIREKMTLFWLNHFGTETQDIGTGNFCYTHNQLLRTYALGNFKALVKQISIDAAMLRYLNGYLNTATAPDENYSRELLELFTCGKGPASLFTESDVKEAAKVLTGWRINYNNYTTYFDSPRHSTANKTFSSFFGGTTINGLTGAAGANELDSLLNMIFNQQEVSKFIVRKLYRFFLYYEIDSVIETNIIEPLAAIFRTNNYEVKPVLEKLLNSEHFFDVLNKGCQIKSPVDLLIGMHNEFSVAYPAVATDYDGAYGMWNYTHSLLANMQQSLHDPPGVSGWPPYYQEPNFHEIWINSDTLPKRNQYSDIFITNGYTRSGKKLVIDAVEFTKSLPNPGDPNELINDALSTLFSIDISTASKNTVKTQILLSNQTADYYWTNAWTAYLANPANVANFNIVNNRLKDLYKYFMNLAEYQLC
jgi:uncharacterized protein (DUF1800 family)